MTEDHQVPNRHRADTNGKRRSDQMPREVVRQQPARYRKLKTIHQLQDHLEEKNKAALPGGYKIIVRCQIMQDESADSNTQQAEVQLTKSGRLSVSRLHLIYIFIEPCICVFIK